MSSQLFNEQTHAQKYRLSRPGYPKEVFDYIINYYFNGKTSNEKIPQALDVACGSGQATIEISKFCDRVIGIDISANQIAHATQAPNIEYRCHAAEDLTFIESNSIDLITIATGLHWLDVEKFVEQVKRVLKPDIGVLAVWIYGIGKFHNAAANDIFREFDQVKLFPYWDSRRWLTDTLYETLLPLLPYKANLIQYTIEQENEPTIGSFIDFVETFSGVQTYKKQEGERAYQDLINSLRRNLIKCFTSVDDEIQTDETSDFNSIKLPYSSPIRIYLMRKNETN